MKKIILQTDSRNMAALAARITLAFILFPHGAQKMLGWFGGYGFDGTMNFFTGVKNIPYLTGLLVILIEFTGPFGLLAGFATRIWALAIIADMAGIIFSSHTQYGFFMNWFGNQAGEGYEYHLLVTGLALTLILSGSGKFSIDSLLTNKKQVSH
ncbi:MAG: DoxX family protein [Chitinophagales bacterium]|nr:DoxX family protein [Chitinophagales bacterium]